MTGTRSGTPYRHPGSTPLAELAEAVDLRLFHRLLPDPEQVPRDYPPLTRALLERVQDGLRRQV
ncbi:hypothetical protein [Streptomyces sp. NRRL S-241]|uniref:hypothetical protein n=1 Tax=Streptomyces sp. NRRL S-241 TaxID=1463896 RepID=UPI0004BF6416|nr:hypothetical protein [Streptomyces sp. NRRL S-241]